MIAPQCRSDAGFTLTELLVAAAIMLTITSGVFSLMHPVHGAFKSQPEVADMQQRLRVAVDAVTRDLLMAGAGTYTGAAAGPLSDYIAPILPYRTGFQQDDPAAGVFFRPDAITMRYVPTSAAQTTVSDAIPVNAQELRANLQPNCPPPTAARVCGLEEGMRALIFDPSGVSDTVTIAAVANPSIAIQHAGDLSRAYAAGAHITEVRTPTYYLKTDKRAGTYQLMHHDGYRSDLPIVDNVVKLEFRYFGDPQPPALLPGKALDDPAGPYTTYGPKPPVLGADNAADTWPAGENCIFAIANGVQVSRLPVMAAGGGEVALPSNLLTDGPWCPDAEHTNRFDADLLRVRRVRVNLRVQVGLDSLRGPAGLLFTHAGTATGGRFVPDQEISFDVTPRNVNLAR